MKKIHYQQNKSFLLFPISILFLLVVGILISTIQVQQKQTSQSHASAPTPTLGIALQNCIVPTGELQPNSNEQQLLDQINTYRQENNLPPFTDSDSLQRAAAWLSQDMLTRNNLNHIDSLGRDITARLINCGYPTPAFFGEIIDSGESSDSATLLNAWKHSPAQSTDLLNTKYTNAGVALATGNGSYYWTLDLGGPAPTFTPTPTSIPTMTPTIKPTATPGIITPTSPLTITPTVSPVTATPTSKITVTGSVTPTSSIIDTATPYVTPWPSLPFKPTNTPVPTIDPDYIPNPNDTQLFIAVKLPGIGKDGNPAPHHATRRIQVNLYDTSNNLVKSNVGYLKYDNIDNFTGIIHFGTIPNNTYYVKVVGDNTLQKLAMPEFQDISNTRLNIIPTVTLVQGDINSDNIVDINDYNLALTCFQNNNCDASNGTIGGLTPTPTPVLDQRNIIDFNDDGIIDARDYNLLLQNYWSATGD